VLQFCSCTYPSRFAPLSSTMDVGDDIASTCGSERRVRRRSTLSKRDCAAVNRMTMSSAQEDLQCLWYLALGNGDAQHKLPLQPGSRMTLDELKSWASTRYVECGRLLDAMDLEEGFADFEFNVGVYSYVMPAATNGEVTGQEVVQHIKNNFSNQTVMLPEGFCPVLDDIGSVWRLRNNYSEATAEIINVHTKRCQQCAGLFLESALAPIATPRRAWRKRAAASSVALVSPSPSAPVEPRAGLSGAGVLVAPLVEPRAGLSGCPAAPPDAQGGEDVIDLGLLGVTS